MTTFPIIEKLGGRKAAHEKLRSRGYDHTIHAIRMWEARGSMPGDAVVMLLGIAEDEGTPAQSSDFMIGQMPPRRPRAASHEGRAHA
ncbi:hypothetical protein TSH7_25035 [Azospirillum sp. TSH7]|uniref:hypothetical protein n=1 Tax=unclassified Azospirillum TaxID=2630922 RepID=UPI000D61F6B6|nr:MULTISPECIES: hypothetical protein [unclassified Azospirillum]PWC57815.1 hypothetical protein TSH7_25035 [Azospirillum sp. TSH7]PWC70234.1 hypothetical protein TSH20_07075 [Azospirillum sp. TSH20]